MSKKKTNLSEKQEILASFKHNLNMLKKKKDKKEEKRLNEERQSRIKWNKSIGAKKGAITRKQKKTDNIAETKRLQRKKKELDNYKAEIDEINNKLRQAQGKDWYIQINFGDFGTKKYYTGTLRKTKNPETKLINDWQKMIKNEMNLGETSEKQKNAMQKLIDALEEKKKSFKSGEQQTYKKTLVDPNRVQYPILSERISMDLFKFDTIG